MIYFQHERVNEHITRIRGAIGEFIYLIEGREKALLIDTGCGLGNLRRYVERLTELPLTVAITHGHYDHCGGMYLFDEVWIPAGEMIDCEVSYSLSKAQSVISLRGFDMPDEDIVVPGSIKQRELKSGMLFDLGGIRVEAIACPGHTPNTMTFLIERYRMLLTGDACHSITYMHFSTALPIHQYVQNLETLVKRERQWDSLLLSHATGEASADLIHQMIRRCYEVMEGRVEKTEAFDESGMHFVAISSSEEARLLYRSDNI